MGKAETNPLDAALMRLEPHVGSASTWAIEAQIKSEEPPDPKHAPASRLAREPAIRDAISKSCLEWIESGRFPIADFFALRFLFDRMNCAYSFGFWLRQSGFEAPHKSENEILGWLLVDCWDNILAARWAQALHDSSC